jgi:aminotransferase
MTSTGEASVHSSELMERALSQRARDGDAGVGNRLIERSAQLQDVIFLGRGDPDLPTPSHIVEAARLAMEAGHTHYTALRGLDSLREAIAAKLRADNGIEVDPDEEVLITTGTQEAVAVAMLSLVDPGDEVILSDPYYHFYENAIQYAGGKLVTVRTHAETGFAPDPEEIGRAITPRTKAIVLLTPNNPTGALYPRATLEAIADVALASDVPIISDELYESTVFGDDTHFSIGSIPAMADRAITINGFSKCYRMTGFRVGYMVGPSRFVRSALKVKQTLTICAPSISQHAAVAALTGSQGCIKEAWDVYAERRAAFLHGLDEIGIPYFRPGGTFYVFADVSGLGMSSEDLCLDLLERARVFIFPGSSFGAAGEGYVRISLLAPTPRLIEGLDRIEQYLAAGRQRAKADSR